MGDNPEVQVTKNNFKANHPDIITEGECYN